MASMGRPRPSKAVTNVSVAGSQTRTMLSNQTAQDEVLSIGIDAHDRAQIREADDVPGHVDLFSIGREATQGEEIGDVRSPARRRRRPRWPPGMLSPPGSTGRTVSGSMTSTTEPSPKLETNSRSSGPKARLSFEAGSNSGHDRALAPIQADDLAA